jgi:hypothetical protein
MLFTHEQLYSAQGHRLTRSLFKETAKAGDTPIMSLGRFPKADVVQLFPIYLELAADDPSEYEFAIHVFGTYGQWQLIADSAWMKPYIEEWRQEADVRRKSTAFRRIHEEVTAGERSAYTAAKYLIEEPWKDKRNPKTKEISQTTSTQAAEGVKDDVLRMSAFVKKS